MNKCFKHVWSVSRQRYVVASELTRGHRPSKGRSLTALSALLLGLMGSSAMAASPVDAMAINDSPTTINLDTFRGLETLLTTEQKVNGVLFVKAPVHYTLNKGISTFKATKATGSVGFKYMDNIDGFFAWEKKAAVLVGYEADEAETDLFQNLPNRGQPTKDNAAFIADGGFVQLGHASGGKKHGSLVRFGVTTGEGAVVNGDFKVRQTIFMGSQFSDAEALLTVHDGASLSTEGKIYVRQHGTVLLDGTMTTAGTPNTSYVVNLNAFTVGATGVLSRRRT